MANKKEKQQEVVALLHTAVAFADKIAPFLLLNGNISVKTTLGVSPFAYLLKLLETVGVTRTEIESFIANIIIVGIPPLELAVKAALLTNLKKMVSCSLDPRIPYKYRKRHKSDDTSNEHGIDINLESIDIFDKLSVDPLSDEGQYMYFGTKDAETVYELVRAEDFDAFLWFVMHKGKFPFPSTITGSAEVANSNLLDSNHGYGTGWTVDPSNATLHVDFSLNRGSTVQPSTCIPGNTFTYGSFPISGTGSSVMPLSMCDKVWYDEKGKICQSEIVPISDDQVSVDWYRSDNLAMVTNMLGTDNVGNRTAKEKKGKPICNLQYLESSAGGGEDTHTGFANSVFRFSILPKPKYNIPNSQDYFSPFAFKPYTFDGYGNYDRNGWWTVAEGKGDVTIDALGKVTIGNKDELVKHLYPCYNGLTVYEFNYDFVMGMRLFDAKNIAWTLIESLSNTFVGVDVKWGKKQDELSVMAREIIKNIINSDDDTEIEDCYFSFDNSKYDEMIRRAQEKKARMEDFGNGAMPSPDYTSVKEIFAEYDDNATLNERIDVISRVFRQVSATVGSSADNDADSDKIGFNFATDMLEQLVYVLVKSVLSPKVMLLLYVNKEIMGGFGKNPTYEELLRQMRSIIVAVVKEVRDMILAELYSYLISKLQPLIELMSSLIIKESMSEYTELLNQIAQYCSLSFCGSGGNMNSVLDNVDYADIDTPPERPKTNNC